MFIDCRSSGSYDEQLVQGIARVGNTREAVKNKEDVGAKVITTLQSSLQGYLADVTVDLGILNQVH